jgi:RIO kinase 1
MHDPLTPLLADGVIEELVARLKSGKEADVWLARHGGEVVAAKVYKERELRSFKNDAAYKEGRLIRNTRTQRAIDRGSRFGQQAAAEAWKGKEADSLYALTAAGVRVPRPVLFYEGVLLMELVLDEDGHPAPRLIDAHVPREHARPLYEDLRAQAVKMLCCDLIHGDLSPYNILAGAAGPVIIDFPQAVGAAHNSQAERFFLRDIDNLRCFFQAVDPSLRASAGDGREIWRAYVRRELTPEFVPSGRPPPAAAQHGRASWDRSGRPGHVGHSLGAPHGQPPHGGPPAPRKARPPRAAQPGRGPQPPRGGPPSARTEPERRAKAPAGAPSRPGHAPDERSPLRPAPHGQRDPHPTAGHAGQPVMPGRRRRRWR